MNDDDPIIPGELVAAVSFILILTFFMWLSATLGGK